MTDTHTTRVRAGRREWIGLAVLALPCVLVTMDLTVLFLAVPELTAALDPSSTELLWVTDIYGFVIAGALITMGTLGDRIGRRRVLLAGAAAFGVASVLAALSTRPEMLIAARALQGLAGATLAPSAMALVFAMFADERQRTAALGVMMAAFAGGAGLGPIVGGVLLEFFSWGSVFLANVPVMLLLLVLGPRLVPEFRNPDAGRLDLVSAGLSLVAVLAVIYGVKDIATDGVTTSSAVLIAAGLAIGAVFLRRQLRLGDPLIDVRLFRVPQFSTALVANVVGAFSMYGVFLFTSQYLQLVTGLSPLEAGLWGLPGIAALMVVSTQTGRLVDRLRPASIVAAGLVVAAVGLVMLLRVDGDDSLALLVAAGVVMSAGIAPAATLGMSLIVGAAPPEQAGSVSGVSETGNELGGALGIALLGSLGTAVYRSDMSDAVPADVAPGAAGAARDTLSGAVDAAGRLPQETLEAANAAFASGLTVVAAVCAALMIAVATLTAVVLRDVRSGAEDGGAAADGDAAPLAGGLAAEAA